MRRRGAGNGRGGRAGPSGRRIAPRPGGMLLGALLGAAFAACKSNPIQHVRSGYERTETGSTSLTTQTNLVEIGIQDHLGSDLEYRLNDKFVQSSQEFDSPLGRNEDQSTLHRPSLDLILTSGTVRWSQLFQSQADRTLNGSGPDNNLVRNDILEKVEWSPVDLPQVTAWVDFRTVEDDFFVDQKRVETRLELQQDIQPFDYEYSFRGERTDDIDVDVRSDRIEHIARLTYQDRLMDDELSATASLFASERRNTVDVPAGTSPSLQVFPTLAFAAVDTTPEISSLPTNPGLIDGNTSASAGVDIGGFATGGELSWNLAAQLPPGATVDTIELLTVAPVPASFVSSFSFSVWVSDDNAFWTLARSSAVYVYDQAFQRFRITIPSVSNRFVKVVNNASPAAAPSVLIAEMELFRGSLDLGTNSTVNDDSVRSATTNLAWRVSEALTLGSDLLLQQSLSDTDDTRTRDETRVDAGVWGSWSPVRELQANVRASVENIDDPVLRDERLTTFQSVLSYRPLRTLDIDLSVAQTDRNVDGDNDVHTDVAQVLASAELLPTLRAEVSLERNDSQDSTNERDIERWITGAALVAELTRDIDATLRARRDDATVSGPGASGIPDPSENRYEMTFVWRPGERLILETELRWIDSFAGEGLDQRWRLDWIPFSDGAIDTQLDYDRTSTRSFEDERIDRYRAQVRYGLGAFTYLEFQYAAELPQDGDGTRILTLAFAYNS